jgi:uncharacterized protein (DUF4415 family)
MQTARKSKTTSPAFSPKQIAAAKAAAAPPSPPDRIDWSQGTVSPGGGVAATIAALRQTRGKNKNPTKEQVAIRFDAEVLAAFRAEGPGWQTRMNAVLKEWLSKHPSSSPRRRASRASG